MIRLRPYNVNDVDTILSWSNDERAFYKWSAGILGEYPITKEQFGLCAQPRAINLTGGNPV